MRTRTSSRLDLRLVGQGAARHGDPLRRWFGRDRCGAHEEDHAVRPSVPGQKSQLLLPETDELAAAGVPKTLSFATGYRLDATISLTSHPAAGGLPAESAGYEYNATGEQTQSTGTTIGIPHSSGAARHTTAVTTPRTPDP